MDLEMNAEVEAVLWQHIANILPRQAQQEADLSFKGNKGTSSPPSMHPLLLSHSPPFQT